MFHSCALMQHSAEVWELPKCKHVSKEEKQTPAHRSPDLHGGHNPEIRQEFSWHSDLSKELLSKMGGYRS